MAQSPRVQSKRVAGAAQNDLAHVRERMPESGSDIIQQRARCGHYFPFVLKPETVERRHLEMPQQTFQCSLNRKSPAVFLIARQHLGRTITLQRLLQPIFGIERFDAELAGGKIEQRQRQSADRRRIIVDRLVQKPVLGHRAGGHDARNLAAHQALGGLGIFHLLAQRGGFPRADQLGEITVERVMGNAAHRLIAAVRERRAENGRGDDGILAEHLVKIAETEHHDRALRHLALDREILPHHRCQFFRHFIRRRFRRNFSLPISPAAPRRASAPHRP